MLNKFAVVPEHFILATTAFLPQTHVLQQADLEATLAAIEAYGKGELFAFFNCGPFSGASQPHRHLQLLPVARMKDGLEGEWSVLADGLDSSPAPFATFAERFGGEISGVELYETYLRLYRQAVRAVKGDIDVDTTGEAAISYNMAMTGEMLVLMPRVADGAKIVNKAGETVGLLSLNGTVLAGTALVKSEAEWNALRDDPGALLKILAAIGLPTV